MIARKRNTAEQLLEKEYDRSIYIDEWMTSERGKARKRLTEK